MDASLPQRLDLFRLAMNLGGNRATIAHMLQLYLSSAHTSLQTLEDAQRRQNTILWLQVLHQLKGASQNITARRLAGLCVEAEQVQELPHPHSESMLYHLHKEFALLRIAIESYLQEFSARA
jgi:HPt (histidine-containing phosphotransfer) domain-containing protein